MAKMTKAVKQQPTPRRPDLEKLLFEAIRSKTVVTLRYDGQPTEHSFEPHGVYVSGEQRYCVTGQVVRSGLRNFEIARIDALQLTDKAFTPRAGFDPRDAEYAQGIVAWIRAAD